MFSAAVLFLLSAGGCEAWFAFTPERAMNQELVSMAANRANRIDRDSVRILQQKAWHEEAVFLTYYVDLDETDQKDECVALYRLHRERSQWKIHGAATVCTPMDMINDPIRQLEQLEAWKSAEKSTYLFGLMRDGKSVAIDFEWEDGKAERIDLIDNSFLVLRAGAHRLEVFRGLDADGKAVISP